MPKEKLSRYEAADYLNSRKDTVAYLNACLEGSDPSLVAVALGDVANAQTMSQLARGAGRTREGLYKALSADGNPSFDTILKVAKALGYEMRFRNAA